jgi:DNA-directed RNA polymerase beta subunit
VKFAIPTFAEFGQEEVKKLAKAAGLADDLRLNLYDGRTGELFPNKITV